MVGAGPPQLIRPSGARGDIGVFGIRIDETSPAFDVVDLGGRPMLLIVRDMVVNFVVVVRFGTSGTSSNQHHGKGGK
jgi:hypothetical protein